jgi:hypothetical protein
MPKTIEFPSPRNRSTRVTDGRTYFGKWATEYHIEGLDPDAIVEKPIPSGLKRGSAESKLGGRITRDLKRVEQKTAQQHFEQSEAFLKGPARHFPADV